MLDVALLYFSAKAFITLFCMVSVLFRADIRSVNLLLGEEDDPIAGAEQFMAIEEPSE